MSGGAGAGRARETRGGPVRWRKQKIWGSWGVRLMGRGGGCRRNCGRKLQDITALDARLHEDVLNERRNLSFFLRHPSDGQPVLRTRQRNVIQPALFLMVKMDLGSAFFHELGGAFNPMRAFPLRKLFLVPLPH